MVLPYSKAYPWNKDKRTNFAAKILSPHVTGFNKFRPKLHTAREGSRWKAGNSIQMAYGVRTKDYISFNNGIEQLQKVISVQEIIIEPNLGKEVIYFAENDRLVLLLNVPNIIIDSKVLTDKQVLEFIYNDGFDSVIDFILWFNKPFAGQLIHWTNLKY